MGSIVGELLDNGLRKMFVNFAVSGNRLGLACFLVRVPVMATAIRYKNTPHLLEQTDEIASLHATNSSSTLCTNGT